MKNTNDTRTDLELAQDLLPDALAQHDTESVGQVSVKTPFGFATFKTQPTDEAADLEDELLACIEELRALCR